MNHKHLLISLLLISTILLGCLTSPRLGAATLKEHSVIAANADVLRAFMKCDEADDIQGIAQFIVAEQVFFVDDGAKVLVIDSYVQYSKVRIVEGRNSGQVGWTYSSWVKSKP